MDVHNLIWYEKHRPKKLNKMVLPVEQKKLIQQYIRSKEIPHILLYGAPGSGKTTISKIIINNVAGAKLILNASSNDRGIDTIKTKVKNFAMSQRKGKKHNVVFFDEADGLTAQAQEALKNTIESFNKNCRFIFTANNIEKIIPAILSRCILFKFNTLPKENILSYLEDILEKENIKYKTAHVKKLIDQFYPDIRSIINNMQSCCISGKLNKDNILSSSNFDTMFSKHIKHGKITLLRIAWKDITNFDQIYKWLFNIWIHTIQDKYKADVAITIAEYLYRNKTIANQEINLTACILEILNIMEKDISFAKK